MKTKLSILLLTISLYNCLDTVSYKQTQKESNDSLSRLLFPIAVVAASTVKPIQPSVTLEFTLSTAQAGNSFVAIVYNDSVLDDANDGVLSIPPVGGIVGKLTANKSYSGSFKTFDSSKGITSTIASFATGRHHLFVLFDFDGSMNWTYYNDRFAYQIVEDMSLGTKVTVPESSFQANSTVLPRKNRSIEIENNEIKIENLLTSPLTNFMIQSVLNNEYLGK